MKTVFSLIQRGAVNPRYYIEAIGLESKQLRPLSWLAILVMTIMSMMTLLPRVQTALDDVASIAQYIPDYNVSNKTLTLKEVSQPIYYQAEYAQFVIDDTIERKGIEMNINVPNVKARQIDPTIPFGLYIFKDQAYVSAMGTLYKFTSIHDGQLPKKELISLILSFNQMQWVMYLSIFVTAFLISMFLYWLQVFLIAMMASMFNRKLSQPVPYRDRVKLTIVASFIPILVLELIGISMSSFSFKFAILASITLYTMFRTFRNHTDFIRNIMKKLDENSKKSD